MFGSVSIRLGIRSACGCGRADPPRCHNGAVDCDTCREAISAALDGEAVLVSPDEHLRSCLECREWRVAAAALTDAVRAEDSPVPDLTDAVLARLDDARRRRSR
jgi:predicted anti-sigma-YlaC factor YlaD